MSCATTQKIPTDPSSGHSKEKKEDEDSKTSFSAIENLLIRVDGPSLVKFWVHGENLCDAKYSQVVVDLTFKPEKQNSRGTVDVSGKVNLTYEGSTVRQVMDCIRNDFAARPQQKDT